MRAGYVACLHVNMAPPAHVDAPECRHDDMQQCLDADCSNCGHDHMQTCGHVAMKMLSFETYGFRRSMAFMMALPVICVR